MGLIKFLKNIKYLSKYNIKQMYLNSCTQLSNEDLIDQILYEIPSSNIKKPKILNHNDTIDAIIKNGASICRFGDGELNIIAGGNIPFQAYNQTLASRLKEILSFPKRNLYIGINYEYYYANLENFTPICKKFYREAVPKLRKNLSSVIDWTKQYYSAGFTQLYQTMLTYDFESHYKKLKTIWQNKKVLIVCCKNAIENQKFNIFDNANTIDYLFIPPTNAYSEYENILEKITQYPKNTVIIIMAGPTAKVLVSDLYNIGYQALDLGHLAKDYDYYMQQIERNDTNIINFMKPD